MAWTTMGKLIIIPFDYSGEGVESSSFVEVAVETTLGRKREIWTHCLEFFNFEMLDRGYDVRIVKANGDYILLSELLANDGRYTQRHIRKAHNIKRLLLAGALDFQKQKE